MYAGRMYVWATPTTRWFMIGGFAICKLPIKEIKG